MKIELGHGRKLVLIDPVVFMGLAYKFTLRTKVRMAAFELEGFLQSIEPEAKQMGFNPTKVFTAFFETPEQRQFARRLGVLHSLTSEKLQGDVLPDKNQVVDFNPDEGRCRILPELAVVLVVTDEGQAETVFGFARYPTILKDTDGGELLEIPIGHRWHFDGCIHSPDPRFRKIIQRFAEAGCVAAENDEFYPKPKMTKAEFDVVIASNQAIQKRNPFGSRAHRDAYEAIKKAVQEFHDLDIGEYSE